MEKTTLPLASTPTAAPGPKPAVSLVHKLVLLALVIALYFVSLHRPLNDAPVGKSHGHGHKKSKHQCHQVDPLFPKDNGDKVKQAFDYLFTPEFQNASIARLSGAVKVQTESFDDLGEIGEDKRWDVFYPFHDYLKVTFPKIHSELKVEKVNTHGLVYTWEGSNEKKKPVIIMAHQDVVPVDPDTVDSWTYPPWSGHFDGQNIWGRGASDCKNSLIGTMEALEILLEAGYEPERTIIYSFGFDEECSGKQGAGHLAPFLLERYGKNGIAAIVDEGMGYTEAFGRGFAVPGVAEKGYTDVTVTVRTPGGHSSVPPAHTSIGILAEIITAIEAIHYPPFLASNNPFLEFMQCGAEYAPNFPKKLKKLLDARAGSCKKPTKENDRLAQEAAKLGPGSRYLMQTSQAVDLIKGGTKLNALPETAVATINHRINIGDTPETVYNHIAKTLKPVAEKYNLTLHNFDGTAAGYNAISLSVGKVPLDVAPVTPTNTDHDSAWSIVAGTIRALYGEDTVVAPALMTGNTDTRYYWDLTKNIFRFGPGYVNEEENGLGSIHTVDEHVTVSNHFKVVRWFTLFLRNIAESDLEVD